MITVGNPPYLECSSQGDKRFSAFFARIKARSNKSIEVLYQEAKQLKGKTGHHWSYAKGRKAENQEAVSVLYSLLWDEYIAENPELLSVLTGATGLSDVFGQPGHCCQAIELWRIKSNHKPRE